MPGKFEQMVEEDVNEVLELMRDAGFHSAAGLHILYDLMDELRPCATGAARNVTLTKQSAWLAGLGAKALQALIGARCIAETAEDEKPPPTGTRTVTLNWSDA